LITLSKQQGIKTIDVGIPIWISYLVLPVGMGLLGFYFFVKAYRAMKGSHHELVGEIEHLYETMKEENTNEKGVGA
jgi:C4-dicarboxylate transporter DctQ subunit